MTSRLSFLTAAMLPVVAALGFLHPGAALAQSTKLKERLEKATRVDCTFTALATGNWDGAKPKATVSAAKLETAFVDIDVDGGTAESAGDLGKTFIVVRYREGYLHFMEMSDSGPLRVTTVLAQESANGRLKAVQTRHEYTAVSLPGYTSRPEMYVGDCAVTD
ncbi:MAG TPA: hypothetical protein VFV10_14520 [Gammaproteobacteria bacterium]|nr:hypothetical protein [Gammaproteobacteria bacterium]